MNHHHLLSLALLATSCASSGPGPSPVPDLVAEGRYGEALDAAALRYDELPGDLEAEEEYQLATIAVHLERARRASLEGDLDEAHGQVTAAQAVDPEHSVVWQWREKINARQADRWLTEAQEFVARGDLDSAFDAFSKAAEFQPDNTAAIQGRMRMLLLMNYRLGMGEEYYKEGVRSLRSFWLQRARVQFDYTSQKYIPGHERAVERRAEVDLLLAEERVAIAREFEAEGHFFGAGNEYRLALLLDPENVEAQEGRARMELEMAAKQKLDHAEWLRLRERFPEARVALTEGAALTEVQSELFESATIDIDQQVYELLYDEAFRLERDFQYAAAILKYEELVEIAGYYEDAITRMDTLREYVEQAEDLYARAMESRDALERLGYLLELQLFWPEYRDIEEKIRGLSVSVEAESVSESEDDDLTPR